MTGSTSIFMKTYINVIDFEDPTKTSVMVYEKPKNDGNHYTENDIVDHIKRFIKAIRAFVPNATITWTFNYDGVERYYTVSIVVAPPSNKDKEQCDQKTCI